MDNGWTTDGQRGDSPLIGIEEDGELKNAEPRSAVSAAPPTPEVPTPPKPPRLPSGPHQEFIALFCDLWEVKYGAKYPFSIAAGKNAAAAKKIREAIGDDSNRWREVIGRYLADDDDWLAGHDLAILQSKLPKWLTPRPSSAKPQTSNGKPQAADGNYDHIREFIARGEK